MYQAMAIIERTMHCLAIIRKTGKASLKEFNMKLLVQQKTNVSSNGYYRKNNALFSYHQENWKSIT